MAQPEMKTLLNPAGQISSLSVLLLPRMYGNWPLFFWDGDNQIIGKNLVELGPLGVIPPLPPFGRILTLWASFSPQKERLQTSQLPLSEIQTCMWSKADTWLEFSEENALEDCKT